MVSGYAKQYLLLFCPKRAQLFTVPYEAKNIFAGFQRKLVNIFI